MFKELKQNDPILILDKQEMKLSRGKVVTAGFPRFDSNVNRYVVDISIDLDGNTGSYTVPDNEAVSQSKNLVIASNEQALTKEVERLQNIAKQILEAKDQQELILKRAPEVLAQLSPMYKQNLENEKRFSSLETDMSGVKSDMSEVKTMLKEFIEAFKK